MTDARKDFTEGLRQIADFLDQHPEVPLPNLGSYVSGKYEPTLSVFAQCESQDPRDQRTILADAARAMGKAEKSVKHEFAIWRKFAGIGLAIYAQRDEVCERVVTGTREVTEEVRDPEALAAVPLVTVTKVVEDVEWVCTPLLKPAAGPLQFVTVPS